MARFRLADERKEFLLIQCQVLLFPEEFGGDDVEEFAEVQDLVQLRLETAVADAADVVVAVSHLFADLCHRLRGLPGIFHHSLLHKRLVHFHTSPKTC